MDRSCDDDDLELTWMYYAEPLDYDRVEELLKNGASPFSVSSSTDYLSVVYFAMVTGDIQSIRLFKKYNHTTVGTRRLLQVIDDTTKYNDEIIELQKDLELYKSFYELCHGFEEVTYLDVDTIKVSDTSCVVNVTIDTTDTTDTTDLKSMFINMMKPTRNQLIDAANKNDTKLVLTLLNNGVKLDRTPIYSQGTLHYAMYNCNFKLINVCKQHNHTFYKTDWYLDTYSTYKKLKSQYRYLKSLVAVYKEYHDSKQI